MTNRRLTIALCTFAFGSIIQTTGIAAPPFAEPVVARVEMKLTAGDQVVNVIEKGDLLTVLEERENDYVIVTHDGAKGAVDKVNAVRIAESSDVYTELIQLAPKEGRYYTLRAGAWWALGDTEMAMADFNQAITLGYKQAHAYTSRGLFYAALEEYEKAIADYDEALKVDPEEISALINRAAVQMNLGEFAEAIKDYTAAIEMKPVNELTLHHQRAIAYKAAGMLDKAAADFDVILKARPKDFTAIMGRGYLRFQQKNHQAAIEDFGKAIELNPEYAVAHNNLGYNRFLLGQFAAARKDYERAIELAPEYSLALQNHAWLLATAEEESIRDPKAAVASAEKACELTNYESIGDLSALAAALAANGQFEDAVGWQEKVVDLVAAPYKDFASKILVRYQSEKPFVSDPDKAAAEEKAAAEKAAAEMLAAEKAEAEKLAAEKAAAAEKVAMELAAEQEAAAQKLVAEQLAAEKRTAEQMAAEQKKVAEKLIAQEQAAEKKAAAEREAAAKKLAEQEANSDEAEEEAAF